MSEVSGRKTGLHSGVILVSGLMLLCILGTGLTWWNYSRLVLSSAQGVVFASEGPSGPESRISVTFPSVKADVIRVGHSATITAGADSHSLKGRVISVAYGQDGVEATVILRLVDDPSPVMGIPLIVKGGEAHQFPPHLLTGTKCSVTIDTTIPPRDGFSSK